MEFFEALKTYVIDTRNVGLKEVTGTRLTDEYFAYKSSIGWNITDKASGMSIATGLKTLADCKEHLKNLSDDELAKIETIRLSDKYKEQCAKVAAYEAPKTESFDFMEAFEALDEMYCEKLDQLSIFEL